MNKTSLAKLYRSSTLHAADRQVDAAALLAVLAGKPAAAAQRAAATQALAESAAHADLARMLGELQADSAMLADHVQELRTPALAHGRRDGARRHAHVVHLRWIGSMAACLVLAVGAFLLHERDAAHLTPTVAGVTTAAHPAAAGDRIFASGEEFQSLAAPAHGDELFRSDFSEGS